MNVPALLAVVTAGVTFLSPLPSVQIHELTFEERVNAQEAIERVYYSHQTGATRRFEEVVTREILERKVRTYLKESAALEKFWNTTVTAEMLRAEVDRMSRQTRMPGRLRELYGALGDDPVLIEECLVRPVLAGRLVRNFFAFDQRIHEGAMREAEAVRRGLLSGRVDPFAARLNRTVVQFEVTHREGEARLEPERPVIPEHGPEALRSRVPSDLFQKWLDSLPGRVGEIGHLVEGRQRFETRVLLERRDRIVRFARFEVPKRSWEDWWREVEASLDERSIREVASDGSTIASASGAVAAAPTPEGYNGARGTIVAQSAATPCARDDIWDNGGLDDFPLPRWRHTAVWSGSHMLVWGGSFIPANLAGDIYLNTGGRYDPATDTWTQISTVNAPQARADHTAVWTGSILLVWGGCNSYGRVCPTAGGRYDPITDTWAAMSTVNAPQGRLEPVGVWTGGLMVVWGGRSLSTFLTTGGRYDPTTDTWTPTSTTNAPSGRRWASGIWSGRYFVVWGGVSPTAVVLNTGGRYDPITDTWTPTALVNAPSARKAHSAVWTGTQMIVWGGCGGPFTSSCPELATGGRYDPASDTWIPTSTTGAPAARVSHSAAWTGNQMIVWGGQAPDPITTIAYLTTGGRYDPATDSWIPTATTNAPLGRIGQTVVWSGSQLVVWGGIIPTNVPEINFFPDTGGRYDPSTDTWTPTSTTDSPAPREQHTAIWTGSVMVVWGGVNNSDMTSETYIRLHNTGGRYDPATDTWTPTSATNAPSGRIGHTAVWTGDTMVVWGGLSYDSLLRDYVHESTGGRYNPVTDIWSPTSAIEAPSARERHAAVWTGSEMVVWGGETSTGDFNTGGRYVPSTDTWIPTSVTNAPEQRSSHTAVWTGSRMLVWGGCGPSACLNTGGQYYPGTDTWTAISTTNAPEPRWAHTAVWTGSQMVVWGGCTPTQCPTNTGGRYDPATDTWTEASALNSPEGRGLHTAVWTQREMVVWGGQGTVTFYLSTGGRYDPATDTWSPTSTTNAPSGRLNHAAVWADELMLVWGGVEGVASRSGGRYCACMSTIYYLDADGDGFGNPVVWVESCTQPPGYVSDGSDCDDTATSHWRVPGEVRDLLFLDDHTLVWTVPADGGASSVVYDVIRSSDPADFVTDASCVVSDGATTTTTDLSSPPAGGAFFYVARAQNGCPNGEGSLGTSSDSAPRMGRRCP